MTPEVKELLIKAFNASFEANIRVWEYLTLPLDKRHELMQQHMDDSHDGFVKQEATPDVPMLEAVIAAGRKAYLDGDDDDTLLGGSIVNYIAKHIRAAYPHIDSKDNHRLRAELSKAKNEVKERDEEITKLRAVRDNMRVEVDAIRLMSAEVIAACRGTQMDTAGIIALQTMSDANTKLRATIDRVRALHAPCGGEDEVFYCQHDGAPHRCSTLRVIDGEGA
jgi:hypothetical protein